MNATNESTTVNVKMASFSDVRVSIKYRQIKFTIKFGYYRFYQVLK